MYCWDGTGTSGNVWECLVFDDLIFLVYRNILKGGGSWCSLLCLLHATVFLHQWLNSFSLTRNAHNGLSWFRGNSPGHVPSI